MAAREQVQATILGQQVTGVERDREWVSPYEERGPGERVLVDVDGSSWWVHEDDLNAEGVDEARSG